MYVADAAQPRGPETASPSGSFQQQAPVVNLPKGGGAIRGIGEKFAANPVTGTGSMSVPIATSPGRSGFGPELSLSYDSGAGNGPFGFGWSLSIPAIARKTDKGLPKYLDGRGCDSDVFVLSGAEDLVPVLVTGGTPFEDKGRVPGYRIHRYRPRIEGLFARIERWTRDDGDVHWRSISKDNILTLYGADAASRIADPNDPARIFSWLICETRDDKGNAIVYEYKSEDSTGIDVGQAHECNRNDSSGKCRTANRYLKRIKYGNRIPLLDDLGRRPPFLTQDRLDGANWMFEVVFDYDDHNPNSPGPNDNEEKDVAGQPRYPWKPRQDPFSSYRAGFEVRTYRLCQRVLMFHRFPGAEGVGGEAHCLVRSTDFEYSYERHPQDARNPVYSFLLSVTQTGYKLAVGGGYVFKSLPKVEFEYTQPIVQDSVEDIDAASLENLPIGLDGSLYQFTDLHGEGIPGILTEQAGTWLYKRNLSPVPVKRTDGTEQVKAQFAPIETVALKPNAGLAAGAQFMDLAGDGQPDLVVLDGPTPGLYEHDDAQGWQPFRPFTARLNRDFRDPNLKFVDLDGDGHADVLITEDNAFVWHASLAESGFGPACRVAQALDEEQGPRLVFADGTQSIYLADMSGDGLTDLVRIRNSEVCYWPNLGHCRFGAKVTMDFAADIDDPRCFDHPDQFDHKRVRLADIDGSGTTDIIYLHRSGVCLYFNQSGNRWSAPHRLKAFPRVDEVVSIMPADLLGNGTACLAWSSPLPGDARRPMRYVSLMGEQKPHLLVAVKNNLGSETRIHYAPAIKFYLQGERDGQPWITRLPFPVHVVECVETYDRVSGNRFLTRYAYHHGYFDGEEREFRGFGMVEQWDTEEIGPASASDEPPAATNRDAASDVPPVHTKTWFHTGAYLDGARISRLFEKEYYREPGLSDPEFAAQLLDDTVPPSGLAPALTLAEAREACRALKGAMLRQEVYGLDGSDREAFPYTVTEQNFTIERVQPTGANSHAVFFTHPRESITYHYERNPTDPRIQHALTLEVDGYGNVLRSMAVGYPRRAVIGRQAEQSETHITLALNRVVNGDDAQDWYRVGLPVEARNYELVKPPTTFQRFTWGELQKLATALVPLELHEPSVANTIPYHQWDWRTHWNPQAEPGGLIEVIDGVPVSKTTRLRLIEHVRTLYRPDDLGQARNDSLALLPLGTAHSLALPGETYKLAFTPDLLAQGFARPRPGEEPEALLPIPAEVLAGQGGDRGGYLPSQALKADGRFPDTDADGLWWLPSGRVFYSPGTADAPAQEMDCARRRFYLPHRYRDPFGQTSVVSYDSDDANPRKNHNLLVVRTKDAVGNTVTASNDYRVLQPIRMTDPNGNRAEVRFDALGMVVGTAVMGKADGPKEGDSFDRFNADLTPDDIKTYFNTADPRPLASTHLGTATTRILYDLDRVPACAATIARETHVSDLVPGAQTKLQLSFSYSDGFGREVQKKVQAEPGPVPLRGPDGQIRVTDGQPQMTDHDVAPRWVGSGWTLFNNKGKPVRQFEPFFSDTHQLDRDVRIGVSPWLFYDPVERVVASLHSNRTWEKVVFDPWQQTSYDVNDTLPAAGGETDPTHDPHVGDFFRRLPAGEYRPTWYELRTDNQHADAFAARYPDQQDRDYETRAAGKAAAHADTPTTAHFDTLGRPFLTVARNRVVCEGHPLHDKPDQEFRTRVELDIEGNQRAVHDERKLPDAKGLPLGKLKQRIVMRYDYDLLGNRVHQDSQEAGARWMLNDVAGKPIRAWDSRGHDFTTKHDALRRPIEQYVRGTFSDPDPLKPNSDPRTLNPPNEADLLVDRIEYGEGVSIEGQTDQALNLRTRIYRHCDSAGVATNAGTNPDKAKPEAYDFKGNLLRSTRQLVSDYKAIPDWSRNPGPTLDAETFEGSTRYDALNRPIQSIAPHSSLGRGKFNVIQPVFNEANLLERLDVWLERAAEPKALLDPAAAAPSPVGVANIDYDAKGQRTRIDYKTRDATVIRTTYTYDRETFRLTHLYTRRGVNPATAQGVAFTDDCGGDPRPPRFAAPDRPQAGMPCGLQNLHYSYDPAGNIAHIRDDAQQTIYFKNKRVEPSNDYTYDAVYRLIQATGREHLGLIGGVPKSPSPHSYNDVGRTGLLSADPPGRFAPNDGRAMGTYREQYVYDAVGNFLSMQHRGTDPAHPGWTRGYDYNEPSLIEDGTGDNPLKTSNRLSRTTVRNGHPVPESYSYDPHGNMLKLPQLQSMQWDYRDQLLMSQRQKVNEEDEDGQVHHGERTWYVYEAAGQRVRKVTELADNGGPKDERIYLGGFEIYRQHSGPNAGLVRETLHIMDDKQRIALVETRNEVDDGSEKQVVSYQFGNHLGSAVLELDDEEQIISYEEYAPYGSTTYQAVRNKTETAKRYRYTGKERDEETGLSYHRARYYAPWLGRWTSSDPGGLVDGVNVFMYATDDPISIHDANGRKGSRWQEVEVNNDPGARYHVKEGSDVVQRDKAEFSERYHQGGGDQAVIFTDDKTTVYSQDKIARDLKTLDRFDFYMKYKNQLDTKTLDALTSAMPQPEFKPHEEDKNVYMDASGRQGTAEGLAEKELAEGISGVSPSTGLGGAYSLAAVVLGADAKEAAKMGKLGDAWSPVFSMAAVTPGIFGKNKSPSTPSPAPPSSNPSGDGNLRLPIVNPHFTPEITPTQAFQGATLKVAARLDANRPLIPNYLTPGENRLSLYGPWAQKIVFGNAVERALAQGATPTGFLTHTGDIRPFQLGGPDFIGTPDSPYNGLRFQVTTQLQWEKHLANDAPGTIYGLYR